MQVLVMPCYEKAGFAQDRVQAQAKSGVAQVGFPVPGTVRASQRSGRHLTTALQEPLYFLNPVASSTSFRINCDAYTVTRAELSLIFDPRGTQPYAIKRQKSTHAIFAMNQIRAIQALNKREIENGVSPEASWHTDYRDTAFINFGGLPYELTEGDIITIFSQYGEPVFLKLARDKETGKSKGFGWLKYEDQRSCDLAVDNLGGADIAGRMLRVDHARYKALDDEDPEDFAIGWDDIQRKEKAAKGETVETEDEEEPEARRPMIKEEIELQKLIEEHDDDDPMKGFLVEEKKQEVEEALRRGNGQKEKKDRKHRHHHRSHHRSRRDGSEGRQDRRSRRDRTPVIEGGESRNGDVVTSPRKDGSRERERGKGGRRDDHERHLNGERRRDYGNEDRDRRRDHKPSDRRTNPHDDDDRDRDGDSIVLYALSIPRYNP
ncbi:hypothetical protein O1611_g1386 [Lasiodiplodia mahajangana]|uniref:Uncharacterized protein n=1 Tax=Lasiodiplodia mahajangana TaxID=1108764 RepID=A0ACC2JXT2_9PEZI|nr:hypothetical protein O1611_g1386 [Lasiodiplodia mahajangana]